MATDEYAGPVDFLVFAFPGDASIAAGLAAVLERVDGGIVEILDLECVTRGEDGRAVRKHLADLGDLTEAQLIQFDGIESDILDQDDLDGIAADLESGQFAIALVYEDRSLARAAAAWTAMQGFELFSGGVAIEDLATVI